MRILQIVGLDLAAAISGTAIGRTPTASAAVTPSVAPRDFALDLRGFVLGISFLCMRCSWLGVGQEKNIGALEPSRTDFDHPSNRRLKTP
jgi:hypothetical protein